jgi:CRISPR-associated protein Cas2
MMVLILHKVRPSIRGRLTRWLIQPQSGVYIGHPSARIRDRIWDMVCEEIDVKGGAAVLIHPEASEQGCRILTRGETPKTMVDFEGLVLPKTPKSRR